MKKITTFLVASAAVFAFATTANAQSAATTTTKPRDVKSASVQSKEDKKETAKESKVSSNTETKTAVKAEQTPQSQIAELERKIEANRNNPRFDVKGAEEELARLKAAAGTK